MPARRSFQYYPPTDEYFVSNVNGDMAEKDDNGFISTLTVTLHAPKGLVTHGNTLFVADIDSIRAFSISTGSPLSAFGVPAARFLNDLAISADGVLYVSDSGLKAGMLPTGSDAIWRIDKGRPVVLAKGEWLIRPTDRR